MHEVRRQGGRGGRGGSKNPSGTNNSCTNPKSEDRISQLILNRFCKIPPIYLGINMPNFRFFCDFSTPPGTPGATQWGWVCTNVCNLRANCAHIVHSVWRHWRAGESPDLPVWMDPPATLSHPTCGAPSPHAKHAYSSTVRVARTGRSLSILLYFPNNINNYHITYL